MKARMVREGRKGRFEDFLRALPLGVMHTSSNREVGEFGWIQKLGRGTLQGFLVKITTPLKSIIYVRKYHCSC
jgi:hypothetical protein